MKKRLIIIIPLIFSVLVTSIYQMLHVGLGSVVIPNWYNEKPAEPAPVIEFIQYWTNKSLAYGGMTFISLLLIMISIYWNKNRKNNA